MENVKTFEDFNNGGAKFLTDKLANKVVYWDLRKFTAGNVTKWMFVIADDKSRWCTDENFVRDVMMHILGGVASDIDTFKQCSVQCGIGVALFSEWDGSQYPDKDMEDFASQIESAFTNWVRIDGQQFLKDHFKDTIVADKQRERDEAARKWEEAHQKEVASQDISEVYWNVLWDYYNRKWCLVIGQDSHGLSDDTTWNEAVYNAIEKEIPEIKLYEDMEAISEIRYNVKDCLYDDKQLFKYKPQAEWFKKKMKAAFPDWGINELTPREVFC